MSYRSILFVFILFFSACSSDSVKEALDIIDGVPRKTIDTSRLGVNAFANDPAFGGIRSQFLEVRDTLGLKFMRILFAWDDAVQPLPGSAPNFSFYDDLANAIPRGMDAIVVLTGVPSWMGDSVNWIDGNPRKTFVELWVRKVAARYAGNGRILGFQIWNEPNDDMQANRLLQMKDSPENYVEMLALAHNIVKEARGTFFVLNAATTAINQKFRDTLRYNERMRDAGAQAFLDRWAIHYYSEQFERVIQPDGVADFLNTLDKSIWITESGAQGVNSQLEYGETVWPFLRDQVSRIDRIYQYQFTENAPSASTFGMKNPDPNFPVSDLYIHLRDRNAAG